MATRSSTTEMPHCCVIVDDDIQMLEMLGDFLETLELKAVAFSDPVLALNWFKERMNSHGLSDVDCVISDIQMPGLTGNELLAQLSAMSVDVPVIFATAFGTIESAIQCMKQGAFDYIVKPFKLNALEVTISRAQKLRQVQRENDALHLTLKEDRRFQGLIGRGTAMIRLFSQMDSLANTNANVLVQGESGSGKETIAKAINARGQGSPRPFLGFPCADLTEQTLDSAFSRMIAAAYRNSVGVALAEESTAILQSDGLPKDLNAHCTVYLESIGSLGLAAQRKLLGLMKYSAFLRDGSQDVHINFPRIIASAQHNLMHEVSNGQFLEELFYRLEFVPLQLPPLRDRPEDVQELSCFFLSNACLNHRLQIKRIDSSARSYLCRQRWPGNLRQLKNLMERAAILITSSTVSAEDLERLTSVSDSASNEAWFSKLLSFDELEKEYTQFVLRQTHGRKEETAMILGINRRTLYRKLIEWGIAAEP